LHFDTLHYTAMQVFSFLEGLMFTNGHWELATYMSLPRLCLRNHHGSS